MSELISYYEFKGFVVIDILTEELSLYHVSKIAKMNNMELEKRNFPNIIVDLSKLDYIDTSGLGFIANMKRLLAKHGSDVAVICVSEYILHLMMLTKLETFVKVVSGLDEAVNYFNDLKNSIVAKEINISFNNAEKTGK